MFTIGDFATFTQVSVPALRLWGRLGLLEPASVDPVTGYRRYTAEQAVLVHQITALKGLGFTLAQIRPLLQDIPSAEELRGMLALRHAEAEEQQRQATTRLAMIEARLHVLERSTTMTHPSEVVRKTAPAVFLACVARRLEPTDDDPSRLFAEFGELFAELAGRLEAARVRPVGPAWSLYERSDEAGLVIRAALPIAPGAVPAGVEILEVPPTDVASTMHLGDVQEMAVAYTAVMAWMEASGLAPAGGSAEISLTWDPQRPERNVTELQLAIAGD